MRLLSASCLWLLLTGSVLASNAEHAEETQGATNNERLGAGLFLANVQVLSGSLASPLDADGTITLDLHSTEVDKLREQLATTNNVQIVGETPQTLRVQVSPGARFERPPAERDHKATWVIDYDQPAVTALSNLWRQTTEADEELVDDVSALVRFTGDQIDNPTNRNGLLIASQVAKRREGDCTEYGVLQTALARAAGYASRLVFGLVLVATDTELNAYGHAWSEIHNDEQWLVADATRLRTNPEVQGTWHLPIILFEDEGLGHALELVKFAQLRPGSVTLIQDQT